MFQNDYRREMDGLRPSPAAVERLNRLLEEGAPARRPRRRGAVVWLARGPTPVVLSPYFRGPPPPRGRVRTPAPADPGDLVI